jgi:hypothetical protein
MTFSGNKPPVPDDPEEYPGVSNLADQGVPKQELATKIQKVFRGNMSRKNQVDLTDAEKRAQALQAYHDPFKYSNPINKLRNFEVRDREVRQELERKKLKTVIKHRDHFLGMELQELLVAAGRDPFKHNNLDLENNSNYEGYLADKMRVSQVERGLKLDQLKWDVEESKVSPGMSDRRRSKGGNQRENLQRHTPSNTDLGYSEEIEFDLHNTGDSSSTPGRSTIEMESFIDDLAQSRSISRSRSKGRLKGFRDLKASSSRDESIIENESSGFGFIKNEIKPQQTNNKKVGKFDVNEESDSNPFGVEKKPNTSPAPNPTKYNLREAENPAEINFKNFTSKEKGVKDDHLSQFDNTKYPTPKPGQTYIGLDPSIYGPLKEKRPYIPKKETIHQAGAKSSMEIGSALSGILKSVKANAQLIKDLEVLDDSGPIIANIKRDQAEISMRENEKLSLQLLEHIKNARESMTNTQNLASLVAPLLETNSITVNEPKLQEENTQKFESYGADNFFSEETFMKLYLNAVQSRENFAAIDAQTHQKNVTELEDRIRRLMYAEGHLEEAVLRHRKQIETEKDEIFRRFNLALQEKRDSRSGTIKKRPGTIREDQKTLPKTRVDPKIFSEQKNLGRTDKQILAKNLSPVITEESLESGTFVSDYNESRERIESISWLDSASGKQQKFTTFN